MRTMRNYTIQGMSFVLKTSTRNNVNAFQEAFVDIPEEVLETDIFGQYKYYLGFILDGVTDDAKVEKIDEAELDARQAEAIMADFMPSIQRIWLPQTASSPY